MCLSYSVNLINDLFIYHLVIYHMILQIQQQMLANLHKIGKEVEEAAPEPSHEVCTSPEEESVSTSPVNDSTDRKRPSSSMSNADNEDPEDAGRPMVHF